MALNNQQTDIGEIRTALHAIPPDIPRDEWAKTGMAIKAEFGESGFELWDTWSQGGKSYNQRDSIATWKSIKPSAGGKSVGIGSLLMMAKSHGYKPQKRTQASQSAKPKVVAPVKQENAPAVDSGAIAKAQAEWDAATPVESHPYLTERQVKSHGLRVSSTGNLLVPVKRNGAIVSLEPIYKQGGEWKKGTVKGTSKTDGYFVVGDATGANRIYIGEGYSTCAAVYEVTGHPAVVAFGCGNLSKVAQTIRNEFPASEIVLLADDDVEVMGNPGRTKSTAAAVAVGGLVATPAFGENRPAGATDFNDMRTLLGDDAVRSCLEENVVIPGKPFRNVMKPSEFMVGVNEVNYVWHRVMRKGWVYALTGVPGTGKTAVSLAMAFAFIQGLTYQGRRTAKSRVLYLSGENPDDVRLRFEMMLRDAGMSWADVEDDIRFTLHPFAIDDPVQSAAFVEDVASHGQFDVMFIDTGFAHSSGDDENDNRQMHILSMAMRSLGEKIGNPTVIPLMHPVKGADRNNLLPRGGSSFTGSIDGVLCLWREGDGQAVEMFPHSDKWRGQRFGPMFFELETRNHPTIIDNFGCAATTCVALEVPNPAEKEEAARQEVEQAISKFESEHLDKIVEIIARKDSAKERVTTAEQGGNTTYHVLMREEDFPQVIDKQRLYSLLQKLTRSNRLKRIDAKVDSKERSYYTTNPALWGATTSAKTKGTNNGND